MRFNETIEYEVTTDLAAEPVTLIELKQHLNLLFDTAGSYEFGDDDAYLTSLITVCRKYLENYTGASFGPKTIVALLRNEMGDVEIPFGPITGITTIKDCNGKVLNLATNDYKLSGSKLLKIVRPIDSSLEVTYTAGYAVDKFPQDLKRAILEEAAFRYNHRGEEISHTRGEQVGVGSYCRSSLELATPYKRTSWLA